MSACYDGLPAKLPNRDGGIASHDLAWTDVAGDTTLTGNTAPASEMQVLRHSYLPPEQYTIAQRRASSNSSLGSDEAASTDVDVMPNLD